MRWWPGRRSAGLPAFAPALAKSGDRVAILLPSLREGDATGHDALAMYALLRAHGLDVRLFAETVAEGLPAGDLAAARVFLARGPCLAVFHQSTWWAAGHQLLAGVRGRVVVRDHNVTPPAFFLGVSEEFVRAAREGSAQRAALAESGRVDIFLAASRRNARELAALGAPMARIAVVPPFHRAESLATVDAEEAMLRRFAADPADVLFVGRVAPNKGHLRLLRIASLYRTVTGRALRVRLVGSRDPRHAVWHAAIERAVTGAALAGTLDQVGELSEAGLRAAWLTSRVLLCASEHEGFCLPLLEAQRLGLPIVALYEEGVAETLDGASVVVPADEPLAAVVALRRLLAEPSLREAIVASQRARYEAAFHPALIEKAFLDALGIPG
jgi:glycosyltransferase involved in cell wall biosynthesis